MNTSVIKTLLLASVLAVGASSAFAQTHTHRNVASAFANPNDGPMGEARETAYGQGGSAGTYPTGANVGPGRAAMNHATGN
jgi:hypothetical protein